MDITLEWEKNGIDREWIIDDMISVYYETDESYDEECEEIDREETLSEYSDEEIQQEWDRAKQHRIEVLGPLPQ